MSTRHVMKDASFVKKALLSPAVHFSLVNEGRFTQYLLPVLSGNPEGGLLCSGGRVERLWSWIPGRAATVWGLKLQLSDSASSPVASSKFSV